MGTILDPELFRPLVRAGIARLDEWFGSRDVWKDKIEWRNFDLQEPCRCVMGFAFRGEGDESYRSGFGIGKQALGLKNHDVFMLGFDLPKPVDATMSNYARARDVWMEELGVPLDAAANND